MTVLRGGLLVDGTGAPPRRADVVIEADRIAAVGAPGAVSGDGDGPSTSTAWCWLRDSSTATLTTTPRCCGTPT